MIEYDNIKVGTYWGIRNKDKVIVAVYGVHPFLRADIWCPSFGKQGTIINNVDVAKSAIEFTDEMSGEWK